MRDQYDFRQGKRGPVIKPPPGKSRITIRLDNDLLEWFRDQADSVGGGNYQTMINAALRQFMEQDVEPLEETLRRILRDELSQRAV